MTSIKEDYIWKGVIRTDAYAYHLTITTTQGIKDDKNIVYTRYFNFGSYVEEDERGKKDKKTCVDIYVMYEELANELPNINYKLAKLITTHYDERCSVDERLQRGEGTQHMISTALTFVSKMCPFIEGFEINDASTRQCDNNTTITLSYFSITKYQKTWYEKNFGAYIPTEYVRSIRRQTNKNIGNRYRNITNKNKNSRPSIDKMKLYKETVHHLMKQSLPDWTLFRVLYLRTIDSQLEEDLKRMFDQSLNYGQLFNHIHDMGMSKACIYLQPWIDTVMLSTNLKNYILHTQWVIPIDRIKQTPITNYTKEHFGKK